MTPSRRSALRLVGAALLTLLAAGPARGEDPAVAPADARPTLALPTPHEKLATHGATGTAIYTNNDGLRVVSPWLEASQQVSTTASIQATMRTDFITAASVDMISGASPRFEEVRKEAGFQASYDKSGVRGHAGYTYSTENDTHSHTLVAGGQTDLFSRNLTLALGYGLGLDRLGSVREPEPLWHDRTSHRLDFTATQILTPTSVVSAAYTFQQIDGFQSSPYRLVPLVPKDSAMWLRSQAQWVAERHPDSRGRHGLTLEGRQAVGRSVFLRATWRGYVDTWAIRSNTGELGATWDLGHGFELELSDRLYWQSRASFYRPMYSVDREFITRDRRLAGQLSNSVDLDVRVKLRVFEVLLQGLFVWTRYDDFRTVELDRFVPMADTLAAVIQAAVSVDL